MRDIQKIIKRLNDLKIRTGIILGRMRLALKALLTKYKPVGFSRDEILALLQQCKTETVMLFHFNIIKDVGLWEWCFECFDLTLVELKSGLNFQEVISLIGHLIRGFSYLLEMLNRLLCKAPPST